MRKRHPASRRLAAALLNLADNGTSPRCTGSDRDYWTSDDAAKRELAAGWCHGCPVLDLCRQAADEHRERWHVWAGRDRTRKPRTSTTDRTPA